MNFEKWWEKNEPTGAHGAQTPRHIAQKLWDEWQKAHNRTIDMLRKEHRSSVAYRDTLKRVSTTGCKKRGRCVSKKVNEDYCVVCRPIFNVLFEFGKTDEEVLSVIFASECPDCNGLGTPEPSEEVGGLPDPICPTCKGTGNIYPEDDD